MTSKAFIGLVFILIWHALNATIAWYAYDRVLHDVFNWANLTWVNVAIVYAAIVVLRTNLSVTSPHESSPA